MTSGLTLPPVPVHGMTWRGVATVAKFYADDDIRPRIDGDLYGPRVATPHEVVEAENLVLTAGATIVLKRLAGVTATAIDASNGYMCVGDSATAASVGQTDLQGASKYRQIFDAIPTVSTNTLQAVATIGVSNGNFHWQEAGLANASSGATLINRFVQDFGTKTGSDQWILTVTVTLS